MLLGDFHADQQHAVLLVVLQLKMLGYRRRGRSPHRPGVVQLKKKKRVQYNEPRRRSRGNLLLGGGRRFAVFQILGLGLAGRRRRADGRRRAAGRRRALRAAVGEGRNGRRADRHAARRRSGALSSGRRRRRRRLLGRSQRRRRRIRRDGGRGAHRRGRGRRRRDECHPLHRRRRSRRLAASSKEQTGN